MKEGTPHYHGHRQRLRARFVKSGLAGFADYEVVELLLTLAIPRSDVKQAAKALIERFGNLRGILDAPLEELQQVKGIGSVAPVALRIIRAAATVYLEQCAEGTVADTKQLESIWRARIGALHNEVFEVAYLDSGHRSLRDGIARLSIPAGSSSPHCGRELLASSWRTTTPTVTSSPRSRTSSSPGLLRLLLKRFTSGSLTI